MPPAPAPLLVSYQGEPGAYSEMATRQFFGETPINPFPCTSFAAMVAALSNGTVDRAVLPLENSLAGTIHQNLDLLLRYKDLHIVGELDFRVRHCLVASRNARFEDIKVVRSHYMALDQCKYYLQSKSLTPEVAYDTAGSAKLIHKTNPTDVAAICSSSAAELYDLQVLQPNIEDNARNFTRFLILARHRAPYVPKQPSKSSLVFTIDNNGPGGLYRVLSVFASSAIDLTKIESRHIQTVREALKESYDGDISDETERRWEYVFYVDIARHAEEPNVAVALAHLRVITPFYRVLGAYPQHVSHLHD